MKNNWYVNDVIIIDVVKEGIYMGISNVSSTSNSISSSSSTSTQSTLAALQQQKVLLQNQINQLKKEDAVKNKTAIANYEKELEQIEEQITEASQASSKSETQTAQSDGMSQLAEKVGPAYSVELTGQKEMNEEEASTINDTSAYSVELSNAKDNKLDEKAKDLQEAKKKDSMIA